MGTPARSSRQQRIAALRRDEALRRVRRLTSGVAVAPAPTTQAPQVLSGAN